MYEPAARLDNTTPPSYQSAPESPRTRHCPRLVPAVSAEGKIVIDSAPNHNSPLGMKSVNPP